MSKSDDEEDKIKVDIVRELSADFDLVPEVEGKHLIEDKKVIIDFLARPKSHLVANDFDEAWFGIEAKKIDPSKGSSINRLFWQCLSYSQSEFNIEGSIIRPMFVLACVDVLPKYGDPKFNEWQAVRCFVQYGNVGVLELAPAWRIVFGAASPYYSKKRGKNNVTNLGTNRYVGTWK
jgi:hypothetical protein